MKIIERFLWLSINYIIIFNLLLLMKVDYSTFTLVCISLFGSGLCTRQAVIFQMLKDMKNGKSNREL